MTRISTSEQAKEGKILKALHIYTAVEETSTAKTPTPKLQFETLSAPYILCIEDERPVLGIVCQALIAGDYDVITVAESDRALALLVSHRPEVLLVDLTQRGSAGWQVYTAVKTQQRFKGVVMVDVSARSTRLPQAHIHDFPSIDDHIPQPADIDRLVHAVKVLVG